MAVDDAESPASVGTTLSGLLKSNTHGDTSWFAAVVLSDVSKPCRISAGSLHPSVSILAWHLLREFSRICLVINNSKMMIAHKSFLIDTVTYVCLIKILFA